MKKCDVIIPVYKSPEWVKLCVYALFRNTSDEILNKVYLINDCDEKFTINCLNNLKEKYGNKIVLLQNEKNLGFVGTTNRGMKESKADYVLLLNTDCIITKNAIEKMINNIKDDKSIGLVCPISSNAANLTLEMFEGFNFSDMNNLLERKFKGKLFDACTVVGNCLLITRECINKVGYLDTAYGLGYGEETDYQFAAMSKGFKAKVSIDTYVFHKSEVSFGVSEEKQNRLNKNRELFFSRWGDAYNEACKEYEKNDPIKYIEENISEEDKIVNIDTAFYLDGIIQNAGGVHVVVDMVNYLAINGFSVNIAYGVMGVYKEIMLFNPVISSKLEKFKPKKIVATIWASAYTTRDLADRLKCKLLYFVQGYECFFENGTMYGAVSETYKLADSILTISNYLKNEISKTHNLNSTLINNGINLDLILNKNNSRKPKSITMIMRNNVMKGDWILYDVIKKLDNRISGMDINVIHMNQYAEFPELVNNNLNLHLGPLSRKDVIQLLQKSDIYVDASLNEGFGLTPLEAMAAGNIVVASNSFGNNDYIVNEENGYLIDKVNDSNEYVERIIEIINNNKIYNTMKKNSYNKVKEFDIDNSIEKYINYFFKSKINRITPKLTKHEKEIYDYRTRKEVMQIQEKRRKVYSISKFIPKFIKNKIKKIITFLYNCFDHEVNI